MGTVTASNTQASAIEMETIATKRTMRPQNTDVTNPFKEAVDGTLNGAGKACGNEGTDWTDSGSDSNSSLQCCGPRHPKTKLATLACLKKVSELYGAAVNPLGTSEDAQCSASETNSYTSSNFDTLVGNMT